MDSAYTNGFSPFSTDCHIIIGDGLKGTDQTLVPVRNGVYVKEAKIGTAILDADILISLTHFKGHESTGFGGTLKNLGMGCGSCAGKMEMHSAGKTYTNRELCVGCGACIHICAHDAPVMEDGKITIDQNKCVGCGRCIAICPQGAILSPNSNDILNCKIAEYAQAAIHDRPSFHISLVVDVSPNCDCHGENDVPIVPDVGMFASFDPIALDMACADAVNRQPILPGCAIDDHQKEHEDHFCHMHPNTNWMSAVTHGEKIGLGTREYTLIEVK